MKMGMKAFMLKVCIFVGICGVHSVFAQSVSSTPASVSTASCTLIDPQVFTQNAANQVISLLVTDQKEVANNFAAVERDIAKVLSPLIGIDIMSQFVVPPKIWSASSSDQQQAFEAQFLQYIIGLYSSPLKNFNGQTVTVYPVRVAWTNQQRVQVNSMIHNPAAGSSGDIPVSFILQQQPAQCSWVFIDFVVDNISALANIQAQTSAILKNIQSSQANPSLSDLTAVFVKHNASQSS